MYDVCFSEQPLKMKLSISKKNSVLFGPTNLPLNSYINSLGC